MQDRELTDTTIATFWPIEREARVGAQAFRRARPPHDTAGLSTDQLTELYRLMFVTRRIEEQMVALQRQGKTVGGVFRSLGQEATAVGCAYALRPGDIIAPLIRDLGALLTHGVTPLAMFRQYLGRATSATAGRDLNTHFSDPPRGVLGPVSMLGAMIAPLAGCLLAARRRGEGRVGVAFIGDGGSSTGAFYEGVNFAAVQCLPLVVVIEANQYAYSTATTLQAPRGDMVTRACGFGVPVLALDGNDVLACFEATRWAVTRARGGAGPAILVAETYRRRGHAEHDDQSYVAAGEIDDWARHSDPLARLRRFLEEGEHADQAAIKAIEIEVEAELAHARDTAEAEPAPLAQQHDWAVFEDGHRPHPPSTTWLGEGARWRQGATR